MTKSETMLAFAREQLGELYDLGDHGDDLWDCSGLTMEMVELVGKKWTHSSHSQYYNNIKASGDFDEFGETKDMPRDKDCFIFRYGERTSGKGMGMIHVGYYAADKKTEIQAGGNGPIVNKEVYEANIASGMSKIDAVKNSLARNHPGGKKKSVVSEQPFHDKYFTHYGRGDWMDEEVNAEENEQNENPTLSYEKPPAPVREQVKDLQKRLNAWNDTLPIDAFKPLKIDGKFGQNTQAAVVAYQEAHGLKPDGTVGRNTWKALNSENTETPEAEKLEEKPATLLVSSITSEQADELVTHIKNTYPDATYVKQS